MAAKGADRARGSSKAANTAVTADTTGVLAAALNMDRVAVTLVNNGSVVVYYGTTAAAASSTTGLPIAAGGSLTETDYLGAVYVRTASSTADVRVFEVG